MRVQLCDTYEHIISLDNLLGAWEEFLRGKRKKRDVQEFGLRLMDHLAALHEDLATFSYRHGGYHAFSISDPKPRRIHKASVRDRVIHHALSRVLSPFYDRTFIAASFSCREGRGTHKALDCFRAFARRASRNHTRTCWALQLDIAKCFASIDHGALSSLLARCIPDRRVRRLLHQVMTSFSSTRHGVGLPLGNLTSQLLVNVYLNELDQFVKHRVRARYYLRYADDMVLFSDDRAWLERQIQPIASFLRDRLHLSLHPHKTSIRTVASGVDFLGWVHFPHHRVLRTTTRRRMLKRIRAHPVRATVQSYLGLLGHGNTRALCREVLNTQWLWGARDD